MQGVFLNTLSLYEIFAYFFVYSFLGWVTEVAYHAIKTGKFVNRGFLNGPVCPIYGVGVVVILLILGDWVSKPWLVLLVGILLPTAIELVTGWALETFFHNKWWDYSDRKFNFKGYICPEFALLWGLAVLLVVEVIHPGVAFLAGLLGEIAGDIVLAILGVLFLSDLVITVMQVLRLNRRLAELDEIATKMRFPAEKIGERVAEATLAADQTLKRAKAAFAEKKQRAVEAVVQKMPKRLLKAFPRLTSNRNPAAVSLARANLEQKPAPESTEEAQEAEREAATSKTEQ